MSISTNISGATLKLFDDSLMKHKKEILEKIWLEYLKDKIDLDEFIDSLLTRPEKNKRIKEEDEELDPILCKAKVWDHITKRYHQCKFRQNSEDGTSNYCDKHKIKRNYGDF
jgi:hypothetical protein